MAFHDFNCLLCNLGCNFPRSARFLLCSLDCRLLCWPSLLDTGFFGHALTSCLSRNLVLGLSQSTPRTVSRGTVLDVLFNCGMSVSQD